MCGLSKIGHRALVLLGLMFAGTGIGVHAQSSPVAEQPTAPPAGAEKEIETFFDLLVPAKRDAALEKVRTGWKDSYVPMLLETVSLSRDASWNRQLIDALAKLTDADHGYDLKAWFRWHWKRGIELHPFYAHFKARLYRRIDSRFEGYFTTQRDDFQFVPRKAEIRLDEVRWGGVKQDGIPPLHDPKLVTAEDATYLDGGDIVFGFVIDGVARAYPKRILAWHEMATETLDTPDGPLPIVAVYCTLCGTVIVYGSRHGATTHQLGTSGFLYRSNKLMYDQATQSLWSTLDGEPVIGPLVGQGIVLERYSVVTTTWKEWRRRHPQTRVISLSTGYQRDYSEGAAYRDYFATDTLMFAVPTDDSRLRNKDEVLALVFAEHPDESLALAVSYLEKQSIHHDKLGEVELVVLTDRSGASRVYASGGLRFVKWDRKSKAVDADGVRWALEEERLVAEDGRELRRLPAHRAFWFGWHAGRPETRLVR